eukprot:TRINITY_DN26841_c0_g1_i2.p2 TRINITY_DN26841_c0_g1~~TRINITY_DN26841_c0_g1_i2.p2  ORF type:complete len:277 (+),score=69.18 TRINITY_DN26841_c0_g1_i2:123-953(+)
MLDYGEVMGGPPPPPAHWKTPPDMQPMDFAGFRVPDVAYTRMMDGRMGYGSMEASAPGGICGELLAQVHDMLRQLQKNPKIEITADMWRQTLVLLLEGLHKRSRRIGGNEEVLTERVGMLILEALPKAVPEWSQVLGLFCPDDASKRAVLQALRVRIQAKVFSLIDIDREQGELDEQAVLGVLLAQLVECATSLPKGQSVPDIAHPIAPPLPRPPAQTSPSMQQGAADAYWQQAGRLQHPNGGSEASSSWQASIPMDFDGVPMSNQEFLVEGQHSF